ncbi:hypothetical protein GCM10011519_27090 [Marmoricola endophyticus]|uniref:Methyltransferase domain-containing protein n=1 Tax=Marmoricola endophyticus TaxID=2040280 RepID=A0A917F5D5_9ACTN|nr:class I SAM-dependent methyltransferase [Marmoricola endophyticus]GGF51655.1 hypothetical protein GCM10011519_27090 [Marmoricola endophyticus]
MGGESERIDAANVSAYASDASVSHYAAQSSLQVGERAVLDALGLDLAGTDLLDLGIGGGRTTAALAPLVAGYVGLDYVPELAERARARFPGVRVETGDARALEHEDATFDLVLFSFNGIDGVAHEDRLQILSEVRRVLRPGGRFWFSAHNRGWSRFHRLPWQGRPRPGRVMLRKSYEAWRARANRRRLRPLEVHTDEYAIVNDEAHDYGLLLYYVAPEAQVRQLEAAGFGDVRVYDQWGSPVDAGSTSPESIWLHYVARS